MGGADVGELLFYILSRKVSIVYRVPEFLCCCMVRDHPSPPLQVSVGELNLSVQAVERQGGSHFPQERG